MSKFQSKKLFFLTISSEDLNKCLFNETLCNDDAKICLHVKEIESNLYFVSQKLNGKNIDWHASTLLNQGLQAIEEKQIESVRKDHGTTKEVGFVLL